MRASSTILTTQGFFPTNRLRCEKYSLLSARCWLRVQTDQKERSRRRRLRTLGIDCHGPELVRRRVRGRLRQAYGGRSCSDRPARRKPCRRQEGEQAARQV